LTPSVKYFLRFDFVAKQKSCPLVLLVEIVSNVEVIDEVVVVVVVMVVLLLSRLLDSYSVLMKFYLLKFYWQRLKKK
jgi:hypothetical protein